MANASAKRVGSYFLLILLLFHLFFYFSLTVSSHVAQQNAETIKNLRLGMMVSVVLSLVLRLLFRRGSLSPVSPAFWIYVMSLIPSVFLSRYLSKIGSPRRDPTTGTLISSGEDLGRPGIIEWCFDVIYVTCRYILNVYILRLILSNVRDMSSWKRCIWSMGLVVVPRRKCATERKLTCAHPFFEKDPIIRYLQIVVIRDFSLRPRPLPSFPQSLIRR